tara:strand:+ start:33618 stop:34841 length:1224 start_codon:yes stop_codon:yes gene_type:complete
MKWQALNRVLGGALLVTGTCIGAGMLGVPIATAAGGFYPAAAAFIFCWMMMTLSAFLMLEISLCYPEGSNLISMAQATLGQSGKWIAWVCYLLFLYSLMAAYTSGGSGIVAKIFNKLGIAEELSVLAFVGFFAVFIYLGTQWVDGINRIMMVGLIVAYVALVSIAAPEVEIEKLHNGEAKFLFMSAPLLVTAFGFHLLIPSLKNYMHSHVKELRLAIFLGGLLPLIVYLLWEWVVLGLVPVYGEAGLLALDKSPQPVVALSQALSGTLNNQWMTLFARIFSFCAILTSFVGVALGLFDFLSDGFHIKRSPTGKIILTVLTFLPPTLFSLFYPAGFLLALRYAGVFAAILLVMYPALMVWCHRYHLRQKSEYQVFGGRGVLLLVMIFGCGVICLEVLQELHLLPLPNM